MGNKKNIKILVDAHIFDHSYQGTATYIKGLYNALVHFPELEITLCAFDIDNLNVHFPDPRFKFVRLTSHSKIKRLAIELPSIIRKGKYDYAHFQYIVPLFKNTTFINTVHDLLFKEMPEYFPWSYRLVKGFMFKVSTLRSDLVLTVSEYSKRSLVKYFNVKPSDILVTPNAISINESSVDVNSLFGLNKYILFVSRFEPRKNHLSLLNAYLELGLHRQGYQLVFVGSKRESIEIDAYNTLVSVIPAEAKSRVTFLENVSSAELTGLYQQATCFVFPSLAEGFGIPPIEAGLNNCKVLCSNTTAMQDFDFFKYRFNPLVQSELKAGLEAILADEKYPYKEVKSAIEQRYNWNAVAQLFYDRIMQNK